VRSALLPMLVQIGELTARVREYDAEVRWINKQKYPETGALQQAGGGGADSVLGVRAALERPERFCKNRDVGCYVGLVPRQDDLGDSSKQLRISKTGDKMLRKLLVGNAQYLLGLFGDDSDLRRFGLKLAARGGKNASCYSTKARHASAPALAYGEEYVNLTCLHNANSGLYHRDRQINQQFAHTSALWRESLVPGSEKGLLVGIQYGGRNRGAWMAVGAYQYTAAGILRNACNKVVHVTGLLSSFGSQLQKSQEDTILEHIGFGLWCMLALLSRAVGAHHVAAAREALPKALETVADGYLGGKCTPAMCAERLEFYDGAVGSAKGAAGSMKASKSLSNMLLPNISVRSKSCDILGVILTPTLHLIFEGPVFWR
jgi:hypothetical protein